MIKIDCIKITLIIFFSLCFLDGHSQKIDLYKITAKQNRQAKTMAKQWLENHSDTVGISCKVSFERLRYNPDEWIYGKVDSIICYFSDKYPLTYVDSLVNLYAEKGGFYTLSGAYYLKSKNEKGDVYFRFTRRLKLLSVTIKKSDSAPNEDYIVH
jgi:hypothetical protein